MINDPLTAEFRLHGDALDLRSVLDAWQGATTRLEQTHEALREEVRRLTDELEVKNRELARKNRLADLGQIASHIAHEVRNNLVPVSLYMSLLRRRLADDGGSLQVLDKVETGFLALDTMVNDLLNFTTDRKPNLAPVRVAELVEQLHESLAPQFVAQQIRFTADVPEDLVACADREMVRRAVLNLVLNAIDAMPAGGELVITGCADAESVEIEVADSGPGLDDNVIRRAFEPFFTTKNGGIGLGLAIVYQLVESHGGCVVAQNCHEGGAAFTIRIPRWTSEGAR